MIEPDVPSLCRFLRHVVDTDFQRDLAIVGVSGGIDSAVTLALCAAALGAERTLAVLMPERENSPASTELAVALCESLAVKYIIDDITSSLVALGCYTQRDHAVRQLIPEYSPPDDRLRVRLSQEVRTSRLPATYQIVVERPDGTVISKRPSAAIYREMFAASNYKQRIRTTKLYYHAERSNGCVIGTSNFDEEFLGFFVKLGDGTWDACPLESLTKTEVRRLGNELNLPEEILQRPTTTDTFPVDEQSQEEMFYVLPFEQLDPVLGALRGSATPQQVATDLEWPIGEVENAIANLSRRHASTRWNRLAGLRFSEFNDR